MKQNNFNELRNLNDELKTKRFENDYDYPWDDRYTTGIFDIDRIRRSFDVSEIVLASKKY